MLSFDAQLPMKQWMADGLLLLVACIWGTTFVTVKNALHEIGPYWFVAVRFSLAFLLLVMFYGKRLRRINKKIIFMASQVGLALLLGYICQTAGLQYTTASNSGFITGLSVAIVPLIIWVTQGHSPGKAVIIGVVFALIGLACLTLSGSVQLNKGDIYTLGCAVAFAAHIVLVGKYVCQTDAITLAILQIGVVALGGTICGAIFEPLPLAFSPELCLALVVMAVIATAFALMIQNTVQKYTTPSRTGIVFATEPVFAGLAGYVFLDEILTGVQLLGCVLMLMGTLVVELGEKQNNLDDNCQNRV